MTTIGIVCVAGVSGTFLARRLATAMPEHDFTVTTMHALPQVLGRIDGVLVAPQLAGSEAQLRMLAGSRPLAVLPSTAMAPDGSPVAAECVRTMLETRPESEPRSEHV